MNPIEWLALPALPPPSEIVLLVAVLLLGAMVGEGIARTTRLPRVVGYTLAGWGLAAMGLEVQLPLSNTTRWVIDLALALLLFEIGCKVHLRWLRHNPGLLATSLLESAVAAVAVYFTVRAFELPPQIAAACAVLAIPTSAAVAGRVAVEMGADGQVTQRMTHLTALNTLYGVLALIVFKAVVLADQPLSWLPSVHALAVSSAGALVLAIALAGAVALVARRLDLHNDSAVLLLLGLVLLAVSIARWFEFSTLLAPLLAGLLLRNTTEHPWIWPRHFGTAGGVLVLLLFVFVGAAWSPEGIAAGGLAAFALLGARGLGKAVAVIGLHRWAKSSLRQSLALSVTLTPLSATALVMLSELVRMQPDFNATLAPIILTSIIVLELLGPIAVQWALRLAGDLAPVARPARGGKR